MKKNQNRSFKTKKGRTSAEDPAPKKEIRLNQYIAHAGVCSRREADELIKSGQIKVNGQVITEMGYKVKKSDNVFYDKKQLKPERFVYVLLNKPKDFICTTSDPHERKTVMQLVNKACKERIYPVGRLDRNTTGLLLLTNDGDLSKKLTHPSHNISKIYQVELNRSLINDDLNKIVNGVMLEDGLIEVDDISLLDQRGRIIGLEIHSGKNRIVRRIFESLGYEVEKLDRTTFAGLTKKDLPRGKWRHLTQKEIIALKLLK